MLPGVVSPREQGGPALGGTSTDLRWLRGVIFKAVHKIPRVQEGLPEPAAPQRQGAGGYARVHILVGWPSRERVSSKGQACSESPDSAHRAPTQSTLSAGPKLPA